MIEKLAWDSNFFGLSIGKIWIQNEHFIDPVSFLLEAKNNYNLVYVFSNLLLSETFIREADLDLVDIMITMSRILPDDNKVSEFQLRTALSTKELQECYEIAEQTAEVSRFYSESIIGKEKAKALYRKWIDNSINAQYADGIIIEKTEDTVSGIYVVKTIEEQNSGLCSLIGVNSKFKGRGIGRKLWDQAFAYWAHLDSVKHSKVPFSIKNSESFNFHLKIGFNKVEEIKYIYHFRNNN